MEEEFKCPICRDFFKKPLRMTPCGHTFCQECLTVMTNIPWPCPVCRTEQQQRPEELARNYGLETAFDAFMTSQKNMCATHGLQKKLRK